MCLDMTTNTTRLIKTLITTLTYYHDPGLAWKTWIVQSWTLSIGVGFERWLEVGNILTKEAKRDMVEL